MDFSPLSSSSNTKSLTTSNTGSQGNSKLANFGIGQENSAEVELSPQARILQQNEQAQQQSQQSQSSVKNNKEPEPASNEFIRVSSSIGRSSQGTRMTSEEALDAYRSIEKLL